MYYTYTVLFSAELKTESSPELLNIVNRRSIGLGLSLICSGVLQGVISDQCKQNIHNY